MQTFENAVMVEVLEHLAGRQIQCPRCARVLDWANTVDATLWTLENEMAITFCGPCFDATVEHLEDACRREGYPFLVLDKFDGRWLSHPQLPLGFLP